MKDRLETFGVTFTPEKLEALKLAYRDNIARESFVFEDKEWLTEYVKYLIPYLTGVFMTGRTEYNE